MLRGRLGLQPRVRCGVKKKAAFCSWGDIVIDTSVSDFGRHSFSVAAPRVWDELTRYSNSRLFQVGR